MVAIKEAGPNTPIQFATEVPKAEQNSFARFLEENNETFDRHSFLTYELRDEEAGRKNSPTLDAIAEKALELAFILYPQINRANSKEMRKIRRRISENNTKFIFGNSSEKGRFTNLLPQTLSAQRRLPPQSDVLTVDLTESLDDFRTSYNEATAPLVSGIRESKTELMGKFEEFLLSSPSNIYIFADFLSDKKNNGAKIEAIRPFLSSLIESEQSLAREKKEGILSRVVKQWTVELKEKPKPATIDEFTASIKSPNILEWLEFAAQGENIANFLKTRPDVSTWTTELREAFFSFVSSRYVTARSSIEKELEGFRRPLVSKSMLPHIDLQLGKAKRASATAAVKKEPDGGEGTIETTKKEKYPIGILTKEIGSSFEIRVLTEEELTRRLQKEADSLAASDSRMMKDIENIVRSLRVDPYGNTKRLNSRSVGVGDKSLPIRSMNPGRRIGLHLEHPESSKVRITYVIGRNGASPVIGIEGIYKHEEYDREFGS